MTQFSLDKIKGRSLTTGTRADLLQNMVRTYVGDYVEIGTAYGSSAILAALANPKMTVHCIDPMDGMYGKNKIDIQTGYHPSPELLEWNCMQYDIEYGKRVILHRQKHPPFPKAIADLQFGVGYIDGDHSVAGCIADYEGLKDRCQCLIFDNYEKGSVKKGVKPALAAGWNLIERVAESSGNKQPYQMVAIVRS